jgi:hypothetical protein
MLVRSCHRHVVSSLAAALPLAIVCFLAPGAARAQAVNPCAAADARLAARGTGDADHDGLSDCRERKLLHTDPRNFDSDHDGVPDATELADGTNPMDADSDDDGLSDGAEKAIGSDPLNADTDDDGIADGTDADPNNDLDSEIRGAVGSLTCPAGGAGGSIVVLGISIALDLQTRFEGGGDCAGLQAAIAANGGAHVQVVVQQGAGGGLLADKIAADDIDNDGSPNHVDADDDNDGVEDVADADADGNGVPDVEDGDHHAETSGHP